MSLAAWSKLAVLVGGVALVAGSQGLGCENTVRKSDGSTSTSSDDDDVVSTAASCSNAASIDGDGNGCPCGTDACGFCQACSSCDSSAECGSGFVCIHSDGKCGNGVKGECVLGSFPSCPLLPRSCTCEGMVQVVCGTVDVSTDASLCSHGTFACGPDLMCKDFIEYCYGFSSGPPDGGGPTYQCLPAPRRCTNGIAECDCIDVPQCTDDSDGHVTALLLAP